jgi:predicted amidohydrolase
MDSIEATISLAQMNVIRARPAENLAKAEQWIAEAARRGSDLICFPEMWPTGFNWERNRELALEMPALLERIGVLAREHGIWIGGSMPVLNEQGRVSNTFVLLDDEGTQRGLYRKMHLFTLMHEEQHVAAGDALSVVDTPWGRAGLSVCYDIRFPELFRTYALQGVEFVLAPIAFPHPRRDHWNMLVRARAIENQLFMIGVNQVGSEDFGPDGRVSYFGTSVIIDPWGRTVVEASQSDEQLLTVTIDTAQVKEIRARMTVLQDRRPDLYRLD